MVQTVSNPDPVCVIVGGGELACPGVTSIVPLNVMLVIVMSVN